MIRSATQATTPTSRAFMAAVQILGGSVFLALLSQIAIPLPFTMVPLTLQLFAVLMLGATLGSKKGALSVLAYLTQGTVGLPVFAGGLAKPLWFMGPHAGYLVGFVAAAFVVGYLLEKIQKRTLFKTVLVMLAGSVCVTVTGGLWLALFIGFKPAIQFGIVPFIIPDALKAIMAASSVMPVKYLTRKL